MGKKDGVRPGPNIVWRLNNTGRVREPTYSFYMKKKAHGRSHVDFGKPDNFYVKGQDFDSMVKFKMEPDMFWSAYTQAMGYGPAAKGKNAWALPEPTYSIFDTGSTHIFVPGDYLAAFMNYMIEITPFTYEQKNGFTVAQCNADWKSLWFMVQGYWIQLTPQDYLVDVSPNKDKTVCHLLMVPNTFNFFVLGLPTFYGYYVVHNMGKNFLGWIPHDDSMKEFLTKAPLPEQILEVETVSYALIVFLVIALFFVSIGVVIGSWASGKYGSSSDTFYIIIGGYSVMALLLTIVLQVVIASALGGKSFQTVDTVD